MVLLASFDSFPFATVNFISPFFPFFFFFFWKNRVATRKLRRRREHAAQEICKSHANVIKNSDGCGFCTVVGKSERGMIEGVCRRSVCMQCHVDKARGRDERKSVRKKYEIRNVLIMTHFFLFFFFSFFFFFWQTSSKTSNR